MDEVFDLVLGGVMGISIIVVLGVSAVFNSALNRRSNNRH